MKTSEYSVHFSWVYDLAFGHGRYMHITFTARVLLGIGFAFMVVGTLLSCLWLFLIIPLPFGLVFFGCAFAVTAYLWCLVERMMRVMRLVNDPPLLED